MLKVPTFMTRYANNKIDSLWENKEMKQEERYKKINDITMTIFNYETGRITIDEAMKAITEK